MARCRYRRSMLRACRIDECDIAHSVSWVHSELAPYYPRIGRPSIGPVLMIRMLIIGYVFAIRSERALCLPRVRRTNRRLNLGAYTLRSPSALSTALFTDFFLLKI
jgi:hypothetical protein